MPEAAKYYAIVDDDRTPQNPAGLARRQFTPDGPLDETLRRDFTWKRSSAVYEWERGEELGADLIEISEEEANRIIERFRTAWSSGD